MRQKQVEVTDVKENTKEEPLPKGLSRNNRVIVSNLPFNLSDEEVLGMFSGAHSVKRHANESGVLSGAVFIQCKNPEDVRRFVRTMDGREIKGRKIKVAHLVDREVHAARQRQVQQEEEEAINENAKGRRIRKEHEGKGQNRERQKPEGEEDRTLFVTNLSFKETKEEIKEAFSKYGEVEQCTLLFNKETGISTGRAFVLFKDPASCKGALKDQVIMNNRILVVLKYVSPEELERREAEKTGKDRQRAKKIKDRQEGKSAPMDPAKVSTCRVHISHMDKKLNRKLVSRGIEEYFMKKLDKKVKLRGVNIENEKNTHRNPGYGFVTFKEPEDAAIFIKQHREMKDLFGLRMRAEYAMESKEFLEKGIKRKMSKEERLAKRDSKMK